MSRSCDVMFRRRPARWHSLPMPAYHAFPHVKPAPNPATQWTNANAPAPNPRCRARPSSRKPVPAGSPRHGSLVENAGITHSPSGISPVSKPRSSIHSSSCRNRLARIPHQCHGLRGAVGPAGKESRAARCGASGKRIDAPCRPDSAALRVAPRRPPAASRASTVGTATLFGPLLGDRTPGRDAGRDIGENSGLIQCPVRGPRRWLMPFDLDLTTDGDASRR